MTAVLLLLTMIFFSSIPPGYASSWFVFERWVYIFHRLFFFSSILIFCFASVCLNSSLFLVWVCVHDWEPNESMCSFWDGIFSRFSFFLARFCSSQFFFKLQEGGLFPASPRAVVRFCSRRFLGLTCFGRRGGNLPPKMSGRNRRDCYEKREGVYFWSAIGVFLSSLFLLPCASPTRCFFVWVRMRDCFALGWQQVPSTVTFVVLRWFGMGLGWLLIPVVDIGLSSFSGMIGCSGRCDRSSRRGKTTFWRRFFWFFSP